MNLFYGIKKGQGQDYDAAGRRVPVTFIHVEPMTVWGTSEKTLKVAFGNKKHPNKALQGNLKNLTDKITPKYIREIKSEEKKDIGTKIAIADVFNAGDKVKVTGTTIGKGFAGVMKRHGFHGGPATHGQSVRPRHPGSIGSTTTPGRVFKGKKMAGHMGTGIATVRNLDVFAIKPEENMILIRGLVPGNNGGLVKISKLE